MASPTRWFRKNSKILLVFLTIFAMAVFVVGDSITRFGGGGGGGDTGAQSKNETIATLQNGQSYNQMDLAKFQERHFQTQSFLEGLIDASMAKKKDGYRPLAQMIQPIRGGNSQAFVNEQLIERLVLAKKAEKEGVVYSNAMVADYLDLLSGQAGFSENDLAEINRKANQSRVPLETIRRHLRTELLAQQMRAFSFAGYALDSNPTESAELYRQSMELIECEVLPIDTQQLSIDEKPTASELKKIYDQGKFDYQDVSGKRPGFKQPNQVAIQYVVADFETAMQNEINKLTDEQVQAEYQALVDKKDSLVMELIPEEESKPETEKDPKEADKTDPAPTLEAEKADDKPAPAAEGTESKPPVEGSTNPQGEGDAPKPPAEPSAPVQGEAPPADSNKPGSGEGSQLERDRDFQFVSLQDEEKKQEPAPTDAGETKPTPDAAGTDKVEATPVENKVDSAQAADQPAPQSTTVQEKQDDKKPETDVIDLLGDDSQKKRPIPLEKARDRVKRKLVEKKVADQIDNSMKAFQDEVESFLFDRSSWELDPVKERGPEPTIDLKALARKHGLESKETELLNIENLGETDLGKIGVPVSAPGMQPTLITLAQNLFDSFDQIRTFEPKVAFDFRTANRYVYWLAKKEDSKILTFEESKDAVEKFWKQNKLVEMAIKKAQSIADEVNSKKKLLSELYKEQATKTGEFSWYSTRARGGYGEPAGVKSPGADFMRSTFALQQNQAGIAVNGTRDTVYVVQVVSPRKGIEELGTQFVQEKLLPTKRLPMEVMELMRRNFSESNIDWNQEFHDEMDLKFLGR